MLVLGNGWTVRACDVDAGTHVTINAAAYGDDGCMERLGEFQPADLWIFEGYLDGVVVSLSEIYLP